MLLLKFIALMSLTLIYGSLTFYDFGLFPYFYLHFHVTIKSRDRAILDHVQGVPKKCSHV